MTVVTSRTVVSLAMGTGRVAIEGTVTVVVLVVVTAGFSELGNNDIKKMPKTTTINTTATKASAVLDMPFLNMYSLQ